MFSNFGLAKRLYLVSVILIAALAVIATTAWTSLGEVSRLAAQTEHLRVPQMMRIAAIELNVTRVSLQIRHAILVKTPEDRAATLADIGEKRKLIDDTFGEFKKNVFTDAGRKFIADLEPQFKSFWEAGEANIKLIQDDKRDEAFEYLVSKTIPARNLVLNRTAEEKGNQSKVLGGELNTIESNVATIRNVLVGAVVAIAIGLLATAAYFSSLLRRRVAMSQQVAERVRDGDLTHTIKDDASDEFTPLLSSLADMQNSLSRVVSDVRRGAESVSSASSQIASGNSDLSARTESQASALEQTASSMEELGSTVKQNADNAIQASQLAENASDVAERGGQVVSQVVSTMKDINDSSRKIADIITVIDSIAFQTNILALNAAVEAARAGEQGRGFAVVAGEVRSLARRSAEAAKEIKELITASVDRVAQGTTLVDQAGHTMEEIVSSIRRVTDIMAEISAASKEQSAGVAQAGTAIAQMDQSTQQNAALVEQMAAAASSLRNQAQELVQTVAVFKVNGMSGHFAAPAPAPYSPPAAPAPAPASVAPKLAPPRKAATQSIPAPAPKKLAAKPAPTKATPAAPASAPRIAAPKQSADDDWETF